MKTDIYQPAVVIFGSGISALWFANELKSRGISFILLDHGPFGGLQTLASQGIIHGGLKYALQGALTTAAKNVAEVKGLWDSALMGTHPWMNLSGVEVLSPIHCLWSTQSLGSKLGSFFAGKVMSSHAEKLKPEDYPEVFKHPKFKGELRAVDEKVLNSRSLVQNLLKPIEKSVGIYREDSLRFELKNGEITAALLEGGESSTRQIRIEAQHFIFMAGAGNEKLSKMIETLFTAEQKVASQEGRDLQGVLDFPVMQKRPLNMVMVRGHDLPRIGYVHAIGANALPLATLTTHATHAGEVLWYIGGEIAEKGVTLSDRAQITRARERMEGFLPWMNLKKYAWSCYGIDRAEMRVDGQKRPDGVTWKKVANAVIAWPTKLTLAPELSRQILEQVVERAPEKSPVVKNSNPSEWLGKNLIVRDFPWETPNAH